MISLSCSRLSNRQKVAPHLTPSVAPPAAQSPRHAAPESNLPAPPPPPSHRTPQQAPSPYSTTPPRLPRRPCTCCCPAASAEAEAAEGWLPCLPPTPPLSVTTHAAAQS